ncbi:septum site-determining protein MinD [Candidatus Poribacteria bacterium]|nr:septum site-determining protein MinD [Candidatus Poribacteria bacterium]
MGRPIVVTSGKGGVGKTTTVANLGTSLALMGKKVAIVDADIGLRNLDVVMGLESRVVFTSMDVMDGKCDLSKALIRDKRCENLSILAAAQNRNKNDIHPEQMQKLVKQLADEFDFVFIDCPAGIEQGFDNALAGAQEAIVIVTPEVSSIRDADRVIGLVQSRGIADPVYIINRLAQQMVERGEMLGRTDIQEILAIKLLGVIPEDMGVVGSTNRGTPLALEGVRPAATAYQRISRRLLGEEVPIPEFRNESALARFWKMLVGRA